MLCVVIKGPTFKEVYEQMQEAILYADLVELRLDYFTFFDLYQLQNLRSAFAIPMIFTLRSAKHGGGYREGEEKRLASIRALVTLNPEYFDLENDLSSSFIEEIFSHYSSIKLILSYHNFVGIPEDLEEIYRKMEKRPAFFYKIAVHVNNSVDALRLLCWAKKGEGKLIAIGMGSYGQISRILGPLLRMPITYAALEAEQKSAPGQLVVKTLIELYHYHSLNPHTKIYGLIGDPVEQSIGHENHNRRFVAYGVDALYVKMQVTPAELFNFLQFAKQLPFDGLSVTMPLKEAILPFLNEIDPEALAIGAVNTLHFKEGKIFGFNTDGRGALNAIESAGKVKGKRVVIIGAGGAAKAIAYEAVQRGGVVTILNRDEEKALAISRRLGCIGKGLDFMAHCFEEGYDILINSTSISQPIPFKYILSEVIVMDIMTTPKETLFLQDAKKKGCRILYGYQMFIEQALGQFNIWINER